jgi:ferredoxin-NADP reductase
LDTTAADPAEPASGEPRRGIHESEEEVVVVRRSTAATDVVVLELSDPDGKDLPSWSPGAHIDLLLPEGLTRQYSLCSSPSKPDTWRVAVLREPESRGGSRHIHDALNEGGKVGVRGPRNHFSLASSPRYEFIAGGIGVTPIIPMVEAADADGAEWHLTYGGRSRDSMAFVDELETYGERVTIWPQDEKGIIDLEGILGTPRDDTLVYCCGPEALLAATEKACESWPQGSLHIERFAAKKPSDDGEAEAGLDSFEVVCKRSGTTLTVPADKTVFDVLEEAGLGVMGSCMEGTCGTCEVGVLEGEPAHRDSVLSKEEQDENDAMMVCVSRSQSDTLVLDL